MDRIVSLLGAVTLGLGILLAGGCEQPAPPVETSPVPLDDNTVDSLARQTILAALVDPDPRIRANAVEVVAKTGEVRLMLKTERLLKDPSLPVRFLALLAVGDLEYALAKDEVAQLLNDGDPNIRIAAAYAMTRLNDVDHFKVICEAIASEDQTVRANAALLLGKSGKPEALRFLYWALRDNDSDDKVILQAAESIAMLGDDRIYPKLWTRLISAYADDRMVGIRAMAALGTEEAKNAVVTMLDDPVLEVRLAAAAQLGKLGEPIGEPEVIEVIEKNLLTEMDAQGQERVKILTALAIGEIGTTALTKYLPQAIRDPSKTVRLAAAKAVLRCSKR